MIKFGIEKEFFLVNSKGETVVPAEVDNTLPIDSCGYLVEIRGEASGNIYDAVYSVLSKEAEVRDKLPKGFKLSEKPIMTLKDTFLDHVRRHYEKGLVKYENYLGFLNHKLTENQRTAGIHLSITDTQEFTPYDYKKKIYMRDHKITYFKCFDYIKYFLTLDREFEKEIAKASRNKGFYELKGDGRIEYRSLPNNIDLSKLIRVINSIK
jgi:hypothetical protein